MIKPPLFAKKYLYRICFDDRGVLQSVRIYAAMMVHWLTPCLAMSESMSESSWIFWWILL